MDPRERSTATRAAPTRPHAATRLAALADWAGDRDQDPHDNILRLTLLAKELLAGSSVIYNTVTGATPEEDPSLRGRICYEPMRRRTDDVFLVHNLQETAYALTDPTVKQEGLHTYMGKSVRVGSHWAGALCVAYQEEFLPSEEDQHILVLIATLIGLEEARRRAEDRLRHQQRVAQGLFQTMLSREDRVVTLKEEVNELRKELGLRTKYGTSLDEADLARTDQ